MTQMEVPAAGTVHPGADREKVEDLVRRLRSGLELQARAEKAGFGASQRWAAS
jgi:predicted RNA binding protein with dsRBD fold (UPF0201 family)